MRIRATCLLFLLAFLFLTAEAPSPWAIDELVGKKAPDFFLKDMNEKPFSLSSLKGKVVLINFWATWCPPCRSEMPSLNKLHKEFGSGELVVLAVSTDKTSSGVRDFLSKHPVDFPVLMDSDSKVSRQFKVFSLPTTFLLDKRGVIRQRFLGEEEWDSPAMREKITTLLNSP